jgi:hypothetical protein
MALTSLIPLAEPAGAKSNGPAPGPPGDLANWTEGDDGFGPATGGLRAGRGARSTTAS